MFNLNSFSMQKYEKKGNAKKTRQYAQKSDENFGDKIVEHDNKYDIVLRNTGNNTYFF